jgi:hypothetical protein
VDGRLEDESASESMDAEIDKPREIHGIHVHGMMVHEHGTELDG